MVKESGAKDWDYQQGAKNPDYTSSSQQSRGGFFKWLGGLFAPKPLKPISSEPYKRRDFTPEQIVGRIEEPQDSPKTYMSRARNYTNRLKNPSLTETERARYEKKAKTYTLLAEKRRERSDDRDFADYLTEVGRVTGDSNLADMANTFRMALLFFIAVLAVFFLSNNITGNVISNNLGMSNSNLNFLAIGFLLLCFIFVYISYKSKIKRKIKKK